jgi:hypothetical protein
MKRQQLDPSHNNLFDSVDNPLFVGREHAESAINVARIDQHCTVG